MPDKIGTQGRTVKIDIRDIDDQTFNDLLPECKGCLYWEAPGKFGEDIRYEHKLPKDESTEIKRGWFNTTRGIMGSCGKIIYDDGNAVGYAQYARPHFLENATEYSRELFPPSPEAILLSCLYVQTVHQGKGLGTRLLQAIIEDLRQRGYKALETYSRDDSPNNCSGPTTLYLENGFKILGTKKWGKAGFSLMRLELS